MARAPRLDNNRRRVVYVALTAHRAVEQECNAPLAVALFNNVRPVGRKQGRAAQKRGFAPRSKFRTNGAPLSP